MSAPRRRLGVKNEGRGNGRALGVLELGQARRLQLDGRQGEQKIFVRSLFRVPVGELGLGAHGEEGSGGLSSVVVMSPTCTPAPSPTTDSVF